MCVSEPCQVSSTTIEAYLTNTSRLLVFRVLVDRGCNSVRIDDRLGVDHPSTHPHRHPRA